MKDNSVRLIILLAVAKQELQRKIITKITQNGRKYIFPI